MRKQDSTFNSFCEFINSKDIGCVYRTRNMLSVVAATETITNWKRGTGSTASRRYQTMLKYAGFIGHERHGYWSIQRHVPDWFTTAHLFTLLGYKTTIREKRNRLGELKITEVPRCKMTQEEIRFKLDNPKINSDNYLSTLATHLSAKIMSRNEDETKLARELSQRVITAANTSLTVKKIQPEESTFFQKEESGKYEKQLQENLMMNHGYINSALATLDQAKFLDPVQHARTINIIAQLKDLRRVLDEKIVFTPTSNTLMDFNLNSKV